MSPLLLALLSAGLHSAPEPALEVAVPFGCGRSFPVSQAHQTGSHVQYDAYAWDFRMPPGEPIVAAADGVVRLVRGDSRRGACDPRFARHANYVILSHPGGIETQYLHLVSVVVGVGEALKEGDLLGYSGETGWACGSHLHFKVARAEGPSFNNPSLPARLKGYGDPPVGTLIEAPSCGPNRPYLASLPPAVEVQGVPAAAVIPSR